MFHGAQLVHGDLSEYNILVCPARLVENRDQGFRPSHGNELQCVLIDFGQAVDWRHPLAMELLDRDLAQVRDFFAKKCVKTLSVNMAHEFVTAPEPNQGNETTVGNETNIAQNHSASFPTGDRSSSWDFLRFAEDSHWENGADTFQADWTQFDKQG